MGQYFQVSFFFIGKKMCSRFISVFLECFSRYDLYSKGEVIPDIDGLWPYYQSLIDKYCPEYLEF